MPQKHQVTPETSGHKTLNLQIKKTPREKSLGQKKIMKTQNNYT